MIHYLKSALLLVVIGVVLTGCLTQEEDADPYVLEWDLFGCDPACENGWTCELGYCVWPYGRAHSIFVHSATLDHDDRSWDRNGGSPDPYVVISVDGERHCEWPTVENSYNPEWTGQCRYEIHEEVILSLAIYDEDPYRDDQLMLECDFVLDEATAFSAELNCQTSGGLVIAEIYLEMD